MKKQAIYLAARSSNKHLSYKQFKKVTKSFGGKKLIKGGTNA